MKYKDSKLKVTTIVEGKEVKKTEEEKSQFEVIRKEVTAIRELICEHNILIKTNSDSHSNEVRMLRQMKQILFAKLKTENELVLKRTFLLNNKPHHFFKRIDLHGFSAKEALAVMDKYISVLRKTLRNTNSESIDVYVITGKGKHSKGEPVLKIKMKEYFEKEGIKHELDKNEGGYDITITQTPPTQQEIKAIFKEKINN
jgi:DNA-nicking Smr family endonuclease